MEDRANPKEEWEKIQREQMREDAREQINATEPADRETGFGRAANDPNLIERFFDWLKGDEGVTVNHPTMGEVQVSASKVEESRLREQEALRNEHREDINREPDMMGERSLGATEDRSVIGQFFHDIVHGEAGSVEQHPVMGETRVVGGQEAEPPKAPPPTPAEERFDSGRER